MDFGFIAKEAKNFEVSSTQLGFSAMRPKRVFTALKAPFRKVFRNFRKI